MADPAVLALTTELTRQTQLSNADWNKVGTTSRALANSLRLRKRAGQEALLFFSIDALKVGTMRHR